MGYYREVIAESCRAADGTLRPEFVGLGSTNPYREDRKLCDPCGRREFPTDQIRHDHPDRWVWAPYVDHRRCDECREVIG